jgi:hypothetical protein
LSGRFISCIFYFADSTIRNRISGRIEREQANWAKHFFIRFGYEFLLMNEGMRPREKSGELDLFSSIDDFIYDMNVSDALKAFQAKFDENIFHDYQKSRKAILSDPNLTFEEQRSAVSSLELEYLSAFMDPDLRQDFTILHSHLQHLRVRYKIMRTIEKFDPRVKDTLVNSIAIVFAKVRPAQYNQKIIGECIKTYSPIYTKAALRKTIDGLSGGSVYPRHIIIMNVLNMSAGTGIGGAVSHEIAHLLSEDHDNVPPTGEEKSILVYENVLKKTPDVPILTKEMLKNLPQMYFVSQ